MAVGGRPMNADSRVGRMLVALDRSKNDLIRATGISSMTLGAIIDGSRVPTIAETAYLAAAFEVPARVIRPDLTDDEL